MASPDRDPPAPPAAPEDREVQGELDALFALVRRRYGSRLSAAELDGVRKGIQGVVEGARALRAVRLGNADEPFQPFSPYRSES